jgi:hypothetical protein
VVCGDVSSPTVVCGGLWGQLELDELRLDELRLDELRLVTAHVAAVQRASAPTAATVGTRCRCALGALTRG